MKTSTFLTPLALALILAAAPASGQSANTDSGAERTAAYPVGCPASGHPVVQAVPAEKAEAYERLVAEYRTTTRSLRRELWTRHEELTALSGNDKTDPARLADLADEIRALQARLDLERTRFHEDLAKLDLGAATGTSRAYARFGGSGPTGSMRGYRHGHGCSSNCPAE